MKTSAGDKTVAFNDVIAPNCAVCRFNNPIISDIMIGALAPAMKPDNEYSKITEFEKKSMEERWAYFTKEMEKCIRCNACRQACPSCYCPTCFAEQSQPPGSVSARMIATRRYSSACGLYHMVGRCVDCGSCISVCPMGVDLRNYLKKIDKDCVELFGSSAGSSMEDMPPLGKYSEQDKEDFIFNP